MSADPGRCSEGLCREWEAGEIEETSLGATSPVSPAATLRNPAAGRTLGVYFWLIHIRPF